MKTNILKSLLAGIFIGLGAYVYIACINKGNAFVGSALFSLGLLCVFVLKANLFTGKIGSIKMEKDSIVSLLIMLLFNFIGISIVALLALPNGKIVEECIKIVNAKMEKEIYQVLIDAFFCGIIIQIAVMLYQNTKSNYLVTISIMVFILCGFEHCIANLFYFVVAFEFSGMGLLYFVLYILGNSIGAILIKNLYELSIKNLKNN